MKKIYNAPLCEVINMAVENMIASSLGASEEIVDAPDALSNEGFFETEEKEFPWSK